MRFAIIRDYSRWDFSCVHSIAVHELDVHPKKEILTLLISHHLKIPPQMNHLETDMTLINRIPTQRSPHYQTLPGRQNLITYERQILRHQSMSEYVSIKDSVLTQLASSLSTLQTVYGIEFLALFGSVARREDTPYSDIDLLYTCKPEFDTFDNYLALAEYLESILERKVDLVSFEYLKPRIRSNIQKDVIFCSPGQAAV